MIVEPELRERLKAARADRGYSQRQLSALSGANLSSVNTAETGRSQVSHQAPTPRN